MNELMHKIQEMPLKERLKFSVGIITQAMDEIDKEIFEAYSEDKKIKVVLKLEDACCVCGCTWNTPCEDGCWWVDDNLCSSCATELEGKVECQISD